MKWYSKYLSVFEKPFDPTNTALIEEIRSNLKKRQSNNPEVSVVVIAHNEETRLLACLWSLSELASKYSMEIIGVDNNSSDRTADVFRATGLPWYFEEKKSCGYARNCGRMHARGKYYICIDSDTMYPPLYVDKLVDKLEQPGIVAVSSLWSFVPDKQFPSWKLFIYETLRDITIWLQSFKRPELSVRGMVFAYNLEYGRKVEYRCDIKRGEDGAMAFGLKKFGKIAFVRARKARAISSSETLRSQGGLLAAYKIRLKIGIKQFRGYFRKLDFYKDEDSNLIKH